jgi:hypothetical protein
VNTMTSLKRLAFVALAALAIVLAVNAPGQARGMGGHGEGGHPGGDFAHHGFDGHHGFDRHHGFVRRHGFRGGFGFGPVYPYYGYYGYYPPAYGYAAPTYWYYCPSYGAYYPSVGSCPEGWVPIPAS